MTMNNTPSAELRYYAPQSRASSRDVLDADLCIYGGTAAGVAAALQAACDGLRAVVIENSGHPGGLTAGGLGWTDFGNMQSVGGIAREFYREIGKHYGVEEQWCFEPHAAGAVFDKWIAETGTPLLCRAFLADVQMEAGRITAIRLEDGAQVRAKMFVDATYEGDLMAKAGVRFTAGREGNALYDETINGMQIHNKHQFDFPVDPYRVEGDPGSGLLPGIECGDDYALGAGDRRIQAYNFRMCLTDDPDNRIPFPKPANYNRADYELLARYLRAGWNEVFAKFDRIPGKKTDTNNHGAFSTDFIGRNHAWPTASYSGREKIFQAHVTYQQGLQWFLANDPSVPAAIRGEYARWGLPRDEFVTTGGWPHALYIREARRMVSDYVTTENDCRGARVADDPVALGAYGMDSHNCRRILHNGHLCNEGDVQAAGFKPYAISYRSIVPRRGECGNLFVPVCVSASHIAFGSIRMEPVFMMLGQAAAIAAGLALRERCAARDLPYAALREALTKNGTVLAIKNAAINQIV
jgi:hypothetical protein